MQFTTTDGVTLVYETHGDPGGRAALLVHGVGADRAMYASQIEPFTAAGLYLITADMRGHGQSDPVDPFCVADCAGDMAALLDHLGIAHAAGVGVSMGGLIIQQMAVDFPARLDALVICDSYSTTRDLTRRLAGWTASLLFRLLPKSALSAIITATYKDETQAAARDYLRDCTDRLSRRQIITTRDAINTFHILDRLPAVTAPTLVLVGDGFGQMAVNMARETADAISQSRAIPGAKFEVLPGGEDPSNLIVTDLFNAAVLGFLAA